MNAETSWGFRVTSGNETSKHFFISIPVVPTLNNSDPGSYWESTVGRDRIYVIHSIAPQ